MARVAGDDLVGGVDDLALAAVLGCPVPQSNVLPHVIASTWALLDAVIAIERPAAGTESHSVADAYQVFLERAGGVPPVRFIQVEHARVARSQPAARRPPPSSG